MLGQIMKINKSTKTTADGLAACIGVSRTRVVQLANEGVLERDEEYKGTVLLHYPCIHRAGRKIKEFVIVS